MSDNTKIEWADATVNAINGCSLASPGCTNCYAMKQAHRFEARRGLTRPSNGGMVWTGEVRFAEDQLLKPLAWKRPRRIFWNAHGDTFHDAVPDAWIDKVFAVAALTPQHTHMILTKRSARMRAYLAQHDTSKVGDSITMAAFAMNSAVRGYRGQGGAATWPLPNVWLGVSVEDQTRADERIPDLLATPAAVRFISAEPLLGPVDLTSIDVNAWEPIDSIGVAFGDERPTIDWVIVGGESGPGARAMHPDWARSLRDQCAAAGVAFHFKQWGEWGPFNGQLVTNIPVACNGGVMDRYGKKPAGRLLDGVEHNGVPA